MAGFLISVTLSFLDFGSVGNREKANFIFRGPLRLVCVVADISTCDVQSKLSFCFARDIKIDFKFNFLSR